MTVPYFDDEDVPAVTYDLNDDSVVVIIGSGAGGGTMADELTRRGIDVVLLEAGPRFRMSDLVNDEWTMYDRLTWKDERACTGSSPIARDYPTAPTWTCKGLGGTTLHWAAMCPRPDPYEFKVRSTYGEVEGAALEDWPVDHEEMEPFYREAESKMGVSGRGNIPQHRGSNNYRVMALGAKRMGYRDYGPNNVAINAVPRDGRNACDQIGFCMQGCRSGGKWSTFVSELPRAEATGHCEIRTRSMALRIEHDGRGRVSGVLYADADGRHHLQKARLVCVAANSIETARLLLNSESSTWPDGLANGSGAVGRHYMRHVTAYMYAEFPNPVRMYRGIVVSGLIRDEARHDPCARLRRRLLHGHHRPRPAVLRGIHEPGALGPRLHELDRSLRARRGVLRERRGHAARLQPGDAASQRERPVRAAHRLPQPRRSPQRSRDEALLLPPRDRAAGGGRRAPHLLLAAAAGLAQSRHLPHERRP